MAHHHDGDILNAMAMGDKAQMFDALYRCHARNRAFFLAPLLEDAVSVDNADLLIKKVLAIGACASTVHSNVTECMLHRVAVGGNQKAVQAFLDHGAAVDALDDTGLTALQPVALSPSKDNPGVATDLLRLEQTPTISTRPAIRPCRGSSTIDTWASSWPSYSMVRT